MYVHVVLIHTVNFRAKTGPKESTIKLPPCTKFDVDEDEDAPPVPVEVRESLETTVTMFLGSSTALQPVCAGPSAYLRKEREKQLYCEVNCYLPAANPTGRLVKALSSSFQ